MPKPVKHLYAFGPFVLDVGEAALLREGRRIPLTPKAIETLEVLVENAGRLIDKEELLKRVWPETFVEEATLAKNISTLRKALGDSTESEEYIETVPKRGYRFIAPVQRREASTRGDAAKPVRRLALVAGLAAALLAAFAAGWYGWNAAKPESGTEAPAPVGRMKLAVLPFVNLSGNAEEEYLADGLTEELIAHLARMTPERLAVIARTSAMHFKGSKKTVAQIGKELDVQFVLEGSFRREGERLRVSAQLVQVQDQVPLWAQTYDRDVRDLMTVQDDVARAISGGIRVQLSPRGAAPAARGGGVRTPAPEVHQLYLKGRYFWNKRTEAGYVRAIELFGEAIAKDANFAAAYAGMADAYALLGSMTNSTIPRKEAMPRAREFAEKALGLDESQAEAHTSLAFVKMHFEQNWAVAEREFLRAIELNPSYVTAHHWYAYCLVAQARIDEALREIRLAQELDPLSLIINTDVAEMLYFARRHDEAIAQAQKALELDPSFALAQRVLGLAYEEKGMYAESIAAFQTLLRVSGRADYAIAALGRSYALSGNRREAEKLLRELLNLKPRNADSMIGPAILYTALGNKERAIAWLQRLREQRGGIILIKVEPYFDSLRTEPGFQDIERRMGLNRN